jgi:hypothetical protein
MSCNNWSVGKKCKARIALTVQRQIAPFNTTNIQIDSGSEGVVLDINPGPHVMLVFWPHIQQSVIMDHSHIHNLDQVP